MDEEGNLRIIQGIPRVVSIKEIPSLQLKISFNKGCQIYAAHMEEVANHKVPSIEEQPILKDYEDVFKDIPMFPPNRDIDLSINLIPRASLMCKTPYRMSTLELKELYMQLKELLKRGYILPSLSPLGSLVLFVKNKD